MRYVAWVLIALAACGVLYLLRIYLFDTDWKLRLWWKNPAFDGATPDYTGFRRWRHTWSRPIRWHWRGWKFSRRWNQMIKYPEKRKSRFREVSDEELSELADHYSVYLPEEKSDKLKQLGFDPGLPVYEVSSDFTEQDLQRALFESQFQNPKPLTFVMDQLDMGWDLAFVIESLQLVYLPFVTGLSDKAFGCWDEPEYFLRGYLSMNPVDPDPKRIRINVYIEKDTPDTLDVTFLQVVREPSGAPADAPLIWGKSQP